MSEFSDTSASYHDAIIGEAGQIESALRATQVEDADACVFALREVLYDLKRLDQQLAAVFSEKDPMIKRSRLREYGALFLYGVIPHIHDHLIELLDLLDKELPEGDSDEAGQE